MRTKKNLTTVAVAAALAGGGLATGTTAEAAGPVAKQTGPVAKQVGPVAKQVGPVKAGGHVKVKQARKKYRVSMRMAKRYPRLTGIKMMKNRGWSKANRRCVIKLWNKESGWRWWADNPTSSAYGIPQALPGSKMGRGWRTNPKVQIRWGLSYIKSRYGSGCAAWRHSQARNWY